MENLPKENVAILFMNQARDVQKLIENLSEKELTPSIITAEDDPTSFDAFIIPDFNESVIKSTHDQHKELLDKIRLEGTKGKPILALGNSAKLVIENHFIPELQDLKIEEKQEALLPLNVSLINTLSRKTVFNKELEEDEVVKAILRTGHASLQLKANELDEKEKASITNKLFINDQIAFCYCNEEGSIEETSEINPIKAIENIAGITNKRGNILAIFPHVEIHDKLLKSIKNHILEEKKWE